MVINSWFLYFCVQEVRLVFYLTTSNSIGAYYQECGRAGRDGALSSCVLFYKYQIIYYGNVLSTVFLI
jgi:hypothetical protein